MKAKGPGLALAIAAALLVTAGCSARSGQPAAAATPGLRIFASSSEPTPVPSPAQLAPIATFSAATPTAAPTPTVTPGPVAFVLDFKSERRDVTM
ncbi:MAG: hypothetical protein KGJ86_19895, partial [Chloroflexota bacterium]|nr:hypothetical protein [Chloroflexota bacterium]